MRSSARFEWCKYERGSGNIKCDMVVGRKKSGSGRVAVWRK
jgi:hypothetical protein